MPLVVHPFALLQIIRDFWKTLFVNKQWLAEKVYSHSRLVSLTEACAFVCILINNLSVSLPVDYIAIQEDWNPFLHFFTKHSHIGHNVSILHVLFYWATEHSTANRNCPILHLVLKKFLKSLDNDHTRITWRHQENYVRQKYMHFSSFGQHPLNGKVVNEIDNMW